MARLRDAADMVYATVLTGLEAYLGATAASYGTGVLELTYDSALGQADDFCNNPFVVDPTASPVVDIPTPSEVKLGVFMWTQKLLALRDKGVGGLTGIKTGDLQVNYSVTLIESDPELYAQFVGWRLIPGL